MFSKNFKVQNFKTKKNDIEKIKKKFFELTKKTSKTNVVKSFSKNYKYSFDENKLNRFKKFNSINIFGLGGSSLGIKAIYNFLNSKVKKKVYFYDNLTPKVHESNKNKKLDIIISKSGNTLETIVNQNIFSVSKKLFITESQNNFLRKIANKLKAEIIEHKNFVGGRYSVLSEVGMLPAKLFGLNINKFKKYDSLILNKKFLDTLINNVGSILNFSKSGKTNCVILNYDEDSKSLLEWYQQLVSESLGKKSKGIFPIISDMPKDNHSMMQLFLDGNKNNFFTFFDVQDTSSKSLKHKNLLNELRYLKNHNIKSIMNAQKQATKNIFLKKNIPFRSFEIFKRSEDCLGEIFTYFMLETILLGKMMSLNPFNQPAVEMVKKETKKMLLGKVSKYKFR